MRLTLKEEQKLRAKRINEELEKKL